MDMNVSTSINYIEWVKPDGKLIHGDCLEEMKKIPNNSIDMILCDLPYGTTQNKWDSIIPIDKLWKEYWRICKGVICLTSAQPFTTKLIHSNIEKFKYCWYWQKNRATGVLNAKIQPLREIEEICIFGKGNYNPQNLIKVDIPSRNSKKDYDNYGTGTSKKYIQEFSNYPKQLLKFDSIQRTIHPTQKPVALFEYLIKTYTNAGDAVLDNCSGSGTTAIACINTMRNWICVEKEKEYFDLSVKRIDDHIEELNNG